MKSSILKELQRIELAIRGIDPLGGIEGYIYATDEKPPGINGGTFTAGAPRQREINTLVSNLAGVTLASNIVSGIPAGVYIVFGRAPAYLVKRHVISLVTSQGEYTGTAGYSNDEATNVSDILRPITFTATAQVQLWHTCETTRENNGLGILSGLAGIEIYTRLLMLKIG